MLPADVEFVIMPIHVRLGHDQTRACKVLKAYIQLAIYCCVNVNTSIGLC